MLLFCPQNYLFLINQGSIPQEEGEEETRDLRSRGLCLVPLSCMTYVTGDGGDGGGGVGSGFWPTPPGFGGGTQPWT